MWGEHPPIVPTAVADIERINRWGCGVGDFSGVRHTRIRTVRNMACRFNERARRLNGERCCDPYRGVNVDESSKLAYQICCPCGYIWQVM